MSSVKLVHILVIGDKWNRETNKQTKNDDDDCWIFNRLCTSKVTKHTIGQQWESIKNNFSSLLRWERNKKKNEFGYGIYYSTSIIIFVFFFQFQNRNRNRCYFSFMPAIVSI